MLIIIDISVFRMYYGRRVEESRKIEIFNYVRLECNYSMIRNMVRIEVIYLKIIVICMVRRLICESRVR